MAYIKRIRPVELKTANGWSCVYVLKYAIVVLLIVLSLPFLLLAAVLDAWLYILGRVIKWLE